ncbi:hypothetical protein Y1Q_0013610 [Alligator mississippiensis]|uniref:Uncharacterized protein n=1 Tax=Alligator mississippiensis TaxID=8496 RepID=A0A151P3G0_ALLMI|nr:hypothetical protein Y1Q_0013610 [Alligator mississippiensis]
MPVAQCISREGTALPGQELEPFTQNSSELTGSSERPGGIEKKKWKLNWAPFLISQLDAAKNSRVTLSLMKSK